MQKLDKLLNKSTILGLILVLCSGCTSVPAGAGDSLWCQNDRWQCWSDWDTGNTIAQIDSHNIAFALACPKAPEVCK